MVSIAHPSAAISSLTPFSLSLSLAHKLARLSVLSLSRAVPPPLLGRPWRRRSSTPSTFLSLLPSISPLLVARRDSSARGAAASTVVADLLLGLAAVAGVRVTESNSCLRRAVTLLQSSDAASSRPGCSSIQPRCGTVCIPIVRLLRGSEAVVVCLLHLFETISTRDESVPLFLKVETCSHGLIIVLPKIGYL